MRNQDVFTWCYDDMSSIYPGITSYWLSVNPNFCPIKQKRKFTAPERERVAAEEVGKLL